MMKRAVAVFLAACLSISFSFSQAPGSPVTPFSSPVGMTGLILEATGFGLVIGGGAAASVDLGAAIILMQIAPVASLSGAWVTTGFMQKTTDYWVGQGVVFDGQPYIKKSRTLAIVTTALGAGSLLVPLFIDDTPGAIISIVCAGAAVCTDIVGLYGTRLGWTKAINEAILKSGKDWKALLKK